MDELINDTAHLTIGNLPETPATQSETVSNAANRLLPTKLQDSGPIGTATFPARPRRLISPTIFLQRCHQKGKKCAPHVETNVIRQLKKSFESRIVSTSFIKRVFYSASVRSRAPRTTTVQPAKEVFSREIATPTHYSTGSGLELCITLSISI